jgi:fucose 4-O-acetylase-like acetyltransferase
MPKKYEIWTIGINRNKQEQEREAMEVAIYVQENIVDGLRFSDWVATLVLMTLALGADRDNLYAKVPTTTPTWNLSPWWLATLQVFMVSCGSWWRFYASEGRGETLASRIGAAVSFTLGVFVFVFIVLGLLDGLWPALSAPEPLATDALLIHILVLVWCGYPAVYIWAYFVNWRLPLGRYDSRASLGKDLGFGSLDVTSKAGLAIYSAMRCLSNNN